MATLVSYITFNYVIGGILQFWGPELGVNYAEGERGLTEVGGILTLDTNLLGAIIIASISVWVHNRYFDKSFQTGLRFWWHTSSGDSQLPTHGHYGGHYMLYLA